MEKIKDREEEAKVIFLKEAVMGTEWGLHDSARTEDSRSYQSLIFYLKAFQRDLELHKAVKKKDKLPDDQSNFRRSLWDNDASDQTMVKDTLFAGQGNFCLNNKPVGR